MIRSRGSFETEKRARARWLFVAAFVLFGFLALGIAAVQVWEYTNSVPFCTNTCHDVHPEEPVAHAASYHAQVKCTECHMGRVPVLQAVLLKSTHVRHLPAVLFDSYGRPLESETMRPANESCERCHSAASWHDASAREIRRFLPDEANTEMRTYLLLKTGAAAETPGGGDGMHWHVGNRVEYIAADEHGQEIRWVRVTLPDGQMVEYNDALSPLTPQEVSAAEKRVMDCVDCHNRIGHPFPSPEALVDQALSDGRLSQDLPFIKREILAVLEGSYPSQAAALAAAGELPPRYASLYPDLAGTYAAEIEAAAQVARDLVPRAVFEDTGVSWRSFTENAGHRDDAGCFRCHDGKHLDPEGEAIRLQCTLCHGVPVTVGPGEEPPQMAIGELAQPDSHRTSHFVSDHRILADDTCSDCHGEIEYGDDDSSFCANSSCHSRTWPVVDLDALLAHPVRLEGGHAQATCDGCHEGTRQVAYECAGCHDAPQQVHYGSACEDCHTAAGFALANADTFDHPMPLDGRHEGVGCASCHGTRGVLRDECAACHSAPDDHLAGACESCHATAGWVESTLYIVARGGRIPHAISSGDECAVCHSPSADWSAPADHAPYGDGQCTLCHDVGGGPAVGGDHEWVPGLMQGEHADVACASCHPDGVFQGTPHECSTCHREDDAHDGQMGETCAGCHTPAGWQRVSFNHAATGFRLLGAHRAAECAECHLDGVYAGTPEECVACHGRDEPHRGELGTDCARCHNTEDWQRATMDHALTGFVLTGAHVNASCIGCHGEGSYGGTPQDCVACHGDDEPHGGQFGQDCAACHTTSGWGGATIDHNLTSFPLTGAHTGVGCASCHPNGQYDGTPQNCVACHGDDEPHSGQFGQDCAACHTTSGWGGATVDHNLTSFPLTGAHTGVQCASCHPNGQYDGTPQNCVACHGDDEPHSGQFGQDCAACHTTSGWGGATVDHNLTSFPLTGRHTAVACDQCHPGGVYDGTPTACAACHGEPGYHAGQLGTECNTCHTPDGWLPASYERPHTFPLGHRGANAYCRTCHPQTLGGYTCYNCHDAGDIGNEHREEGIPDYENCVMCHPTGEED